MTTTITHLRRLMGEATSAPWYVEEDESDNDGGTRLYVEGGNENDATVSVCRITGVIEGSQKRWADEDMSEETRKRNAADAALIVAMRAALPAMLDLATAAKEEAKRHSDSSDDGCPCSLCAAVAALGGEGSDE